MTVSTRRQVFRWCAGAATAALMTSAAGRAFAAPQVMNPWDLARYREVFAAIDRGDFIDAQMQMVEVKDRSLSGYVSFRQLMHPTAHVSSFEELSRWLADHADLPNAERIYALAMRRRPDGAPAPRTPAVTGLNWSRVETAAGVERRGHQGGGIARSAERVRIIDDHDGEALGPRRSRQRRPGDSAPDDGQGPGLGAQRATRDRGVQVGDAHAAQALGVGTRLGRLDGGHVDQHRARLHGAGNAQHEEHLLDHGAVLQHGDHELAVLRSSGGRIVHGGTKGGQAFGLGAGAVPDLHGVAGFTKAACHGIPHEAGAQQRDIHFLTSGVSADMPRYPAARVSTLLSFIRRPPP